MYTLKQQQKQTAKEIGANAFKSGLKCIPLMDKKLMELVDSISWGNHAKNLIKCWSEGFIIESLKY